MGGGGSSNPTAPWGTFSEDKSTDGAFSGGNSTSAWGGYVASTVASITRVAQNPDGIIGGAITKIASAIPWVAAAIAVVKLTEYIVDEVQSVNIITSGNHTDQLAWSNFKAGMGVVLHPISTAYNSWKQEEKWRVENQRREQQRALLGDSVINSYTRRGI